MILRIYLTTLILICSLIGNINAQTQIKLDSLMFEQHNFALAGASNSGYALEMTSGDFNGDGIQDVAISSSENTGPADEDTRSINIIFGSDNFDENTFESLTIVYKNINPNLLTYHGFGYELGTGDLNNDGIDDLIIGMPLHDDQKGRLYVVYGKSSRTETLLNIANLSAQDGFMLDGPNGLSSSNGASQLGSNYAIGDFDNDNLNDLFVSFFSQSKSSGFVIFGKAIQGELTVGLDTLSQHSGMFIFSSTSSDNVGNDAAFLDINGDGIDDLLMASENAWSQGRIYTLFGSSSPPDSINISSIKRRVEGITIAGSTNPTLTRFGKDFDTGDFNGDGVQDFIVSATRTGTTKGTVYVVYGGNDVFADNVYPSFLQPGKGLTINGESLNYLGKFLDVADFNNDGIDDIVFTGGIHDLSSNLTGNYDNKLRILLGTDQAIPDVLDLENPSPEFQFFEITPPSRYWDAGNSVVALDINNDSKQDLIFGTRYDDPSSSNESFASYFVLNFDLASNQDSSQTDTVHFDGGDGTELDPYLISKAEQLDSLLLFPDNYFLLTSDLDLSGNNWIPIGYERDDSYLLGERELFTGCFDGGGHTIHNLEINNRGKDVGFFYSVSGCVKNLNFDGATITYVATENLPDSIKNLDPLLLIEDIPRFAGIVSSRIEQSGSIENVTVLNASLEFGSVGLISGWNEGVISNTYTNGVINEANQAGGIAAVNFGSIQKSAFEGTLSNVLNSTGGIAGTNFEGSITESYSTTSTANIGTFGGISGIFQYGIIENNYAHFNMLDSSSVGGIVGLYGLGGSLIEDKPISIINNYSFGEVDSKTEFQNFYRGIIGLAFLNAVDSAQTVDKIKDNYWNEDLLGQEDLLPGFRITAGASSTAELKTLNTFENWDFTNIWSIDQGSSFPFLRNNPPMSKPGEDITSTSIINETEVPQKILLTQNYPNPFNPSTTISYEVPKSGKVTLEVFNMLGRSVAILIGGETKSAGRYSVDFDASLLSSGIYFYRLTAAGQILTQKMTLIK